MVQRELRSAIKPSRHRGSTTLPCNTEAVTWPLCKYAMPWRTKRDPDSQARREGGEDTQPLPNTPTLPSSSVSRN
ncbi:hypothetical protein E2C01_082381 [Portunus trituberculatus]|uniref:Uncharacterized protein n=1 Tax=Portunus trituberculatus TaxID=210409 RepID=A0A5B7J3N9_PORTR|nr:hypothetical protein [Portunus trituberculatus]